VQLLTCQYIKAEGWDKPLDTAMDSASTLLIIFGSPDANQLAQGFAELRLAFPLAIWIGCSTAGEIYGRSLHDDSLSVAVMRFMRTTLRLATYEVLESTHSFQAGASLAHALNADHLKSVFVLSDGLQVNGSALAKGLSQNLPEHVVVTGGLAGDGSQFKSTWVLLDKQPKNHQVVAVGLYGENVGIAHGSGGGLDYLGHEREVTHAEGNVLYTLDGQPALELYKKYLGERATGLPATGLLFPLAIRNEIDGFTVRTIIAVNDADNTITFAGDIPQSGFVLLMRANFERLIDGAMEAVDQLEFNHYTEGDLLTVAISCIGRRLVLTQRSEEEIDAVMDGLPSGSGLIGYYSYGELSPLANGRCDLHNQTMTLTSFWET
jgi:hypothetical protein